MKMGTKLTRFEGFTLIELMVALLLSMLLSIALVGTQVKFGQQTLRTADSGSRDAQIRAAMSLITQDLSSAGFLFGGTQNFCSALLTYNTDSGYFAHHPVDAMPALAGTLPGFTPALHLNYPPTGSAITSDVLVATASTVSTDFNDNIYPVVLVAPNPAYTPMTTGVLQTAGSLNATAGDFGILQVPVSGKRACLRAPLTSVTGPVVTSGAGTWMPPTFYAGFSTQLAAAGFSDVLSNAEINQGRMVDMGAAATPLQTAIAYYVDGSTYPFPMLMRATYSLLDDTPLAAPQAIASGVVALQTLFGVDPTNSGAVTAYESAAAVTSNKHWDFVLSVKVALVTRTINDDPDPAFSGPTSIAIGAPFPDLAVPASHRRYAVQQTEIAVRNLLWK